MKDLEIESKGGEVCLGLTMTDGIYVRTSLMERALAVSIKRTDAEAMIAWLTEYLELTK